MSGTKSPSLPSTRGIDPVIKRVLDPLVEQMEKITGRRRQGKLAHLPDNATTAEIIAAHNALLDRLQE